ncbi:MAG: ribosome assembly cofactor RimP [Bacteroidia bacterium]
MIKEEVILELVNKKLEGTSKFLVSVKVRPANKIVVFFDDEASGVGVADCVELSKYIESNLNRDIEDFELEVSSPGMDQPLMVHRQYIKTIGKQVNVLLKQGEKHSGKLTAVTENGINIEKSTRERTDTSKKKRELVTENIFVQFSEIKETRRIVSFN